MTSTGVLISFDVDGTLAIGEPAGPVPAAFVHQARAAGCVIGSASDRTRAEQAHVWETLGLEPDFMIAKHCLAELRDRFGCARFVHIGDSLMDRYYAGEACFDFLHVDDFELEDAGQLLGAACPAR